MRYNGLQLVIQMALKRLNHPELNRFQDALILGAIREDLSYLPRQQRIWEHWSLSHFSGRYFAGGFIPWLIPSAPQQAQRCFDRAVQWGQQGRWAAAYVELGKASHLLIDMACPVHALRVAHLTDGYEWFIESHCASLSQLDFEPAQAYPTAQATVMALARYSQNFKPDRTNHLWGRLLKHLRLRRALTRTEIRHQAEQIIPVAAAHLAALYQLFLRQTQTHTHATNPGELDAQTQ